MTSVLFDEAHGELARSEPSPVDDLDTLATLRAALERAGWETTCFISGGKELSLGVLQSHNVLFIGGPTRDFSSDEALAIKRFVETGGGLLIAMDAESLWHVPEGEIAYVLRDWGLEFVRYLNLPPESVQDFHPHYITVGITSISVADINALSKTEKAIPIVSVAERGPVFAACLEVGQGRVLAIGDYAPFADTYIHDEDNLEFALRIFRWLAFENPIDIRDILCEKEILLGRRGTLSVVLSNPRAERLGRVKSTVLSDAGALIEPAETVIRAIPAGGQTWLSWTIEPRRLGRQSLYLSLDLPRGSPEQHLDLGQVASFRCTAPLMLGLQTYLDPACTRPRAVVTVDQPFWAEARISWQGDAVPGEFSLELDSDDEHLRVTSLADARNPQRWQLVAVSPGTYHLRLRVAETGQYITHAIEAKPSLGGRIETVVRDFVEPLDDRVRRLTTHLRSEFGDERIVSLPFHLCSPEDFVGKVFPEPARLRLREVLDAARRETEINQPLLNQLLVDIAPTFLPGRGSFVPFDPALAEHLKDVYAIEWESIAQNLVYADGMPVEWLEQNLAAYLIHEKYGHGFFFAHTRLGQQLAILFEGGFLRKADIECLKTPYPREQFMRYREAVRAVADSSIILNEGFAAWLEIYILSRLGGVAGQAVYRRQVQLTRFDKDLKRAIRESAYLSRFTPLLGSRYEEGLGYFRLIEGYFGEDYGPRCAVQAALKAADVHLGITRAGDVVQFALSPEEMLYALLQEERDHARSDMRLRHIHAVLRKRQLDIQTKQEDLLCYRTCLDPR